MRYFLPTYGTRISIFHIGSHALDTESMSARKFATLNHYIIANGTITVFVNLFLFCL